jgi:hypothetical protein
MTDDQIQALILTFLDARGGYVAGASERELFLMVKQACATERERCAHLICPGCRAAYPLRGGDHIQPNGYVCACVAYALLHG